MSNKQDPSQAACAQQGACSNLERKHPKLWADAGDQTQTPEKNMEVVVGERETDSQTFALMFLSTEP